MFPTVRIRHSVFLGFLTSLATALAGCVSDDQATNSTQEQTSTVQEVVDSASVPLKGTIKVDDSSTVYPISKTDE